jgi:hypothetical protein
VRMTTEFPSTGNKRINYFNQKKEISRYSRTNIYSYRDCVAITYIIYARKSTYCVLKHRKENRTRQQQDKEDPGEKSKESGEKLKKCSSDP